MEATQSQSGGSTDDEDGYLVGDDLPQVSPGTYEGTYVGHETSLYKGETPKLTVRFKITSPGPGEGVTLPRYYNVKDLVGDPRTSGAFKVGRRSDYYREFCLVAGRPDRSDRASPVAFRGKIIALAVGYVTQNGQGRPIVGDARYSRITHLLGEV